MPNGTDRLTDEELKQLQEAAIKTRKATANTLLLSFGGLIAFSILILQDAIAVGPVDLAIIISTVACAGAIPLLVASTWFIRAWSTPPEWKKPDPTRLFYQAHSWVDRRYFLQEVASGWLNRASTPMVLVGLSAAFAGIFAALWHVFWVASVIFTLMVIWGFWGLYTRGIDMYTGDDPES